MTPETKALLLSAWRENRLAAVHIDLQEKFLTFRDISQAAFQNTKPYAAALRAANIPNIWVAYPAWRNIVPYVKATVGRFNDHMDRREKQDSISPMVVASRDECIIVKRKSQALDLYEVMPLGRHLMETQKDTLLVSGVTALGCVGATIKQGLLRGTYTIFAVGDCMDLEQNFNFTALVTGGEPNPRFHMAISKDIVETLESGPSP